MTRMLANLRTVLALSAALASAQANATGHSWALYDDTKGMWLTGVIRSTPYERPQQVIELAVEKPAAKTWRVVLASPSTMESRGVPVSRLTLGLKVRVYVYPARDVADECRALRIVLAGNTTELW
jgi:hypothetical protein